MHQFEHDWNILTLTRGFRCTCSCGWNRWPLRSIDAPREVYEHLRRVDALCPHPQPREFCDGCRTNALLAL